MSLRSAAAFAAVPGLSFTWRMLNRDGSQFTCMLFYPRIDGGISLDSAVESQQFHSRHRSTFRFLLSVGSASEPV
jgi:hypothetical protein